jgi:hypothetical protein
MGKKGDDEEEAPPDLRLGWLEERVCASLKVKPEKFKDMDEVALFAFKDFMDKADCEVIYVWLGVSCTRW